MTLDLTNLKQSIRSLEIALNFASAKEKLKGLTEDEQDVIRAGVIQNFEFILNGLIKCDCIPVEYNTPRFTFSNLVEYTYELSWKFMKRWLEHNLGSAYVDGLPRKELFRIAAESRLITHVNHWIEYHDARNETAHTYDKSKAQRVFETAKEFLNDALELLKNLESKND